MDERGRSGVTSRSVCAVLVALVAALVMVGSGSREAAGEAGPVKHTEDGAVGASIRHPASWRVEHERYTYDGSYGYTLWLPEGSPGAKNEHGGTPVVRVARVYDGEPGGVDARVRERISAQPNLAMKREKVAVGAEGLEGVAVSPIPGSTPSTEVYVEDEGSLYQINVYGEGLDPEDEKLLSSLKFERPSGR